MQAPSSGALTPGASLPTVPLALSAVSNTTAHFELPQDSIQAIQTLQLKVIQFQVNAVGAQPVSARLALSTQASSGLKAPTHSGDAQSPLCPDSFLNRLYCDSISSGPYIQSLGSSSATIVWRTSALEAAVVTVMPMLVTNSSYIQADTVTGNASHFKHHGVLQFRSLNETYDPVIAITALKPNTQYVYFIGSLSESSKTRCGGAQLTFRTLPSVGTRTPFRALVLGDTGTTSDDKQAVITAVREYMQLSHRPADLLLLLGDMAYGNGKTDGDDSGYTEKTFNSYKDDLTHTPMFSILGNHEMKSHLTIDGIGYGPYFQRFITPQNGESGGIPSHSAGTGYCNCILLSNFRLRKYLLMPWS